MKLAGLFLTYSLALFSIETVKAQSSIQQYQNVPFSKVVINDNFWKPKIDKVSRVAIPVCIEQTAVKTARIRNFEVAAHRRKGKFEGIFYDDSDVYKALEAIAYSLKNHPDSAMERIADNWIDVIQAAQLDDGYIDTYFILNGIDKRWTDMSMHEDYNGGHLIEAAVAYYEATGKRTLLNVAIKFANHFDSLFGPGKRHWVTGHQELELALVKLYKTTSDIRYLHLADWLLSERGHGYAHGYTWTEWKDTSYAQDLKPVKEQRKITGHAVRAMYMYTGASDVAALTGDTGYVRAMKNVWEDVVYRNMYITGGIGSSGSNEGFSNDYDLPNENAYCETCASVGMVFWNLRMAMLTGESKYMDVLEKSLYNAALDGISLKGDRFFYGNPLASVGRNSRREWFGTACCPANISRLIESLGNYIYGVNDHSVWVNLFIGSDASFKINDRPLNIKMETGYPWSGNTRIVLQPERSSKFQLHIRIPGWVKGEEVPGGLYQFSDQTTSSYTILVNNKPVTYETDKGYIVLNKKWNKGDVIDIEFPMMVHKVVSNSKLKDDSGRIAIQRGPFIYCVEGRDNSNTAWNILLPENSAFTPVHQLIEGEPVIVLQTEAPVLTVANDGLNATTQNKLITAIPYYTWCNRGSNEMQVWLPQKIQTIKINR